MGFAMIVVMGLYLLLSIGVVAWAVRTARRAHGKAFLWGGSSALVMYLIPFWDWIPTIVTHSYYCEKEAGFWEYKTVEQWKKENPGMAEKLSPIPGARSSRVGSMENYADTYQLNHRFIWVISKTGPLTLNRWRWEKVIIDTTNNEPLTRLVDFSTGDGYIGGPPRALKFWLKSDHCPGGQENMYAMDRIVGNLSARIKGDEK